METEANTCDPTTSALMCITTDEIRFVVPIILVAIFVLWVWKLIRHERRRFYGPKQTRGTEPGQGASVLSSFRPDADGRGGTGNTYIHSKNPQDHARAMMPGGSNDRKK
jgi:hypothetical protein